MVDYSTINKAIRKILFPTLKTNGFSKVNLRTSWGYHDPCIWVFNLKVSQQYYRPITAFYVSFGIYYAFIPAEVEPKRDKDDKLIPEESRCHVRNQLVVPQFDNPSLSNKFRLPTDELNKVWKVEADGSNLEASIEDIKLAFLTQGLQWFNDFSNLEYAFQCIDRLAPDHLIIDHINQDGIPIYTGKAYLYGRNSEKHFAQYMNYQERVEAYSKWEDDRKLEQLERAYQMNYVFDTFELAQCLNILRSLLDSYGDSFEHSGFIFTRTGYPGYGQRCEKYWRISKPDASIN